MVCLIKTMSAMAIVLALAALSGSNQTKKLARPRADFVDQPLDLPYLNLTGAL